MYPPQFLAEYPLTATAFGQMVRREVSMRGKEDNKAGIKAELLKRSPDQSLLESLYTAVWAEIGGSRAELAVRTGDAFGYLGVCDEVRALIGGLWSAGFRQWDAVEQSEFLRHLITHAEVHRELALEYLPWAVPDFKLGSHDLWAWMVDARGERATYPHRIPNILEKHTTHKPVEALQLAELFLRQPSDAANARLIALLACWVRASIPKNGAETHLANFESLLASGPAEHRTILLESWAFSAASPLLDEQKAAELKRTLVRGVPEEAKAWCLLLQQVVLTSEAKWPWALLELRAMVQPSLPVEQKFLVLTAALHGWLYSGLAATVPRTEWEALIRSLAPIKSDEAGTWSHLEYLLVDAFEKDAAAGLALVVLVAESSGKGWSKQMAENQSSFNWWCQTLREGGRTGAVVTSLCFSDVRSARRAGLQILRRCGADAFGPEVIANATGIQVERLLLEACIKLGDYDFFGRLHLAFADRVALIGGGLAEWFKDEVLTQALNTNQYREAIAGGAAATSPLRVIVAEAERRIEASAKASDSPALRMRIPGHSRAESLSMRRFGRAVAKGMEKYSVLSQLFPTIPLLYGKSWRMPDATGALGAAASLKKMEVKTEMPRLEFMTPEAMRHRRLLAVKRISELDRGLEEEE